MQRHITLDLTEEEFNELRALLKEEAGMTPKEVLTGFIKDLICSPGRNGLVESSFAYDWLKRAYVDRYKFFQQFE